MRSLLQWGCPVATSFDPLPPAHNFPAGIPLSILEAFQMLPLKLRGFYRHTRPGPLESASITRRFMLSRRSVPAARSPALPDEKVSPGNWKRCASFLVPVTWNLDR